MQHTKRESHAKRKHAQEVQKGLDPRPLLCYDKDKDKHTTQPTKGRERKR